MFCTPCIVSIHVFAEWISRTWGWVLQVCESMHLYLRFANWDVLSTKLEDLKIDRKWLSVENSLINILESKYTKIFY